MPPLPAFGALSQTVRSLTRSPGFTATVVLTLAFCIAANLAIFAVVDAVLVRSLPFAEPERLVTTINSYPGAGADRVGASLPNYYERRVAIKAFASTSIQQGGSATIGESGAPHRVYRDRVSPEFFATLGVPLAMGRTFNDEEMFYKGSGVAILTDAFWRNHFNGDRGVLGKTFQVDGMPVVVIGVLPPGFRYLSSRAQFFIPAASNAEDRGADHRHSNNFNMIARLAPGASLADAQAQIDALNQQQVAEDPYAELLKGAKYHTNVYSLRADHVREIRPILLLLQGGVLLLLLIGGVNLVNLFLIRATGRTKEVSLRQALGANRWHVARDVLLETLVLALGGGLLGVLLGYAGVQLLSALGTEQLPLGATIAFDGRVAGAAFGLSFAVGVALALPIVVFNWRRNLAPALQMETRGGTASRTTQRLRHVFIVGQLALAFVLLTGAGMLGLSLKKVLGNSPGFQADHVLTGQISLPWKQYPEDKPRQAFAERLIAALRTQPGVTFAGLSSGLPFSGSVNDNATAVEGATLAPGESIRTHYTSMAVGEYWQALGIPLVSGRVLEDADNQRDQRVCVIDEEVAKRYWPGQNALGHRLVSGPVFTEAEAATIVGVVGSVKQNDLSEGRGLGAITFPFKFYPTQSFHVVVRTKFDPAAFAPVLQKIVSGLDPELSVDELKTMQVSIDESLVSRRSPALLAGIFAGVALLLAALGTYGILAYTVRQRRREIGVRLALGALPQQVLGQFLGLGIRLLAVGLSLGVLGAWLVGHAMQTVLFGLEALHAGVFSATAAVLVVVVFFAIYLPSRRAAQMSVLDALRDE